MFQVIEAVVAVTVIAELSVCKAVAVSEEDTGLFGKSASIKHMN